MKMEEGCFKNSFSNEPVDICSTTRINLTEISKSKPVSVMFPFVIKFHTLLNTQSPLKNQWNTYLCSFSYCYWTFNQKNDWAHYTTTSSNNDIVWISDYVRHSLTDW